VTKLTADILRWVENAIGRGARVVSVAQMPRSSTEKHDVLVLSADGSEHRLVLRRYTDAEQLATDPFYDPLNEARALRLLETTTVPAPRLYAADVEPAVCDVPALLESWVPGAQAWVPDDLEAYLSSAAETLVAIHAVAATRPDGLPDYVPYAVADGVDLAPPPWTTMPGLWERVIEVLDSSPPPTRSCFIHRDYHPGNALALEGRVVSVVDWATAAWGPPGIDLARMRLNLARDLDVERAERFLDAYRIAGGDPTDRHPFWDLRDAAEALIDEDVPRNGKEADATAQYEAWVARVLAEL
jgi:aminoglycoside phosphotransferase (APT) family kinase protein